MNANEEAKKKQMLARLSDIITGTGSDAARIAAIKEYGRLMNWTTATRVETTVSIPSPFELYLQREAERGTET